MDSYHLPTAPFEHYHVYNRGNHKEPIFLDNKDYERFMFLVLATQYSFPINNTGRLVKKFHENVEHSMSNILKQSIGNQGKQLVRVVTFCCMPNHFHLILEELEDNGIKLYMQKLSNSYTKYFNTKYKMNGHLFQGRYGRVRITDDNQLLYTSAYIHRNPHDLLEWKNREHDYPWSSYQDYIHHNRWHGFLSQGIILDQFESADAYKNFVETNPAKLTDDEQSMLE